MISTPTRQYLSALVLIIAIGICQTAVAFVEFESSAQPQFYGWLAPNERYPQDGKPIFESSSKGSYVSVGTERGFIAAALSQSKYLLLIDIDPRTTTYNRISISLLKAATSMEHLRKMKLDPGFLALELPNLSLSPEETNFIRSQLNFGNWQHLVDRVKDSVFFSEPQENGPFFSANYLYYSEQFAKLQEMARAGRIQAVTGDISNASDMSKLAQVLKEADLEISIFDVSNAPGYFSSEKFATSLRLLSRASNSKTLVLRTLQDHVNPDPHWWIYKSVSMKKLWTAGLLKPSFDSDSLRLMFTRMSKSKQTTDCNEALGGN